MPKLTQATMQRRREHILAAAMQCFLKHGFAATTIDGVCAEGNISKGAFYSHFDSKDALIRGVLAARQAEIRLSVEGQTIAEVADSLYARRMAPAMGRAESRFGLELMAASAHEPDLRVGILEDLRLAHQAIEAAVEHLIAVGAARSDCDAAVVARVVETWLLGALTYNALSPQQDKTVRDSLHALLEALLL